MGKCKLITTQEWLLNPEAVVRRLGEDQLKQSLLIYPTATVWGVGGVPSDAVCQQLQQVKKRTGPFLLIWSNLEVLLSAISKAPSLYGDFIRQWAGKAVTTLIPLRYFGVPIPPCCVSDSQSVAVRVDGLYPLNQLIQASGASMWLSSSANSPGDRPPVTFTYQDPFYQSIDRDAILFEYTLPLLGTPSTIVDLESQTVVRAGAIDISF